MAFKRIKYKEVKDIYAENSKTLWKKIREHLNEWKDILCSWIGIPNIVKMAVLPKVIYRFNPIPTQIPMFFLQKWKSESPNHIELQGT